MGNSWRFFFVIEALLIILVLWQITSDGLLVFLFLMGAFFLLLGTRLKKKTNRQSFFWIIGGILIFSGLINTSAIWLMLVFAVVFIGIKGIEFSGWSLKKYSLNQKKQLIMLETKEPEQHNNEIRKQTWFGNERIGNIVYEWDDINLNILFGDTIVDLGNTLLPKKDNIVMIRKGMGRTRILVPLGVGVQMEHAAFMGDVIFEERTISLSHETLTIYSGDYDENTRRVKIISSCLIGDIEVIRI